MATFRLEPPERDPQDHPEPISEATWGDLPFGLGGEELLASEARLAEMEMEVRALREQVPVTPMAKQQAASRIGHQLHFYR